MIKGDTFTVCDSAGNAVECDILFTYESTETGKEYIVYTDNSKIDGYIQVYASVLAETDDGDYRLDPLESEEEWLTVETLLNEIQETIKKEES